MLLFSDFIQNNRDILGAILAYLPCPFTLRFVSKVFPRDQCDLNPAEYYAECGNANLLTWLKEIRCFCNSPDVLRNAVKFGDISNIEIVPDYKAHTYNICRMAAHDGHLHILKKYLLISDKIDRISNDIMPIAASKDHVHILRWLHSCNISVSRYLYSVAAKNNNINVLRWLHYDVELDVYKHACTDAARYGNLNALTYLHSINADYGGDLLYESMASNNLAVIKYVYHDMGITEMSIYAGYSAINTSNLDICEWLCDMGFSWPVDSILHMLRLCKYDVAEWAYRAGIHYDKKACLLYAVEKREDLLKWSRENKPCPFISNLIALATTNQ